MTSVSEIPFGNSGTKALVFPKPIILLAPAEPHDKGRPELKITEAEVYKSVEFCALRYSTFSKTPTPSLPLTLNQVVELVTLFCPKIPSEPEPIA